MNIFGVGGAEIIAIFIIMLVFAGPKRMIHWSYIMGTYVSKFRKMWSQTVDLVQKEFDEAGLDIKLPKEPPTRQNLNKAVSDAVKPVTAPLQQSINEVKKDMDTVKEVSDSLKNNPRVQKTALPGPNTQTQSDKPAPPVPEETRKTQPAVKPVKEPAVGPGEMGTWSGSPSNANNDSSANGQGVDFGAWSHNSKDV